MLSPILPRSNWIESIATRVAPTANESAIAPMTRPPTTGAGGVIARCAARDRLRRGRLGDDGLGVEADVRADVLDEGLAPQRLVDPVEHVLDLLGRRRERAHRVRKVAAPHEPLQRLEVSHPEHGRV